MKKLLLILFLLISIPSFSTHLIYMDGSVEFQGMQSNGYYRFTVEIFQYRDITNSTVEFDSDLDLSIYHGSPNNNLEKVLTLQGEAEEDYYVDFNGVLSLKRKRYTGTVDLSSSVLGYTFLYGRCCFGTYSNIPSDQGNELKFILPGTDKMTKGQTLPVLSENPLFFLNKDSNYVFTLSPDWINAFDSSFIQSADYFIHGTQNDPIPGPALNLPNETSGLFNTGFGPGNPFGSLGTFTRLNDSQYQVHFTGSGKFLMPIEIISIKDGQYFLTRRSVSLWVDQALTAKQVARQNTTTYPNPARNELTIDSEITGEYCLYKVNGQAVLSGIKSEKSISLDLHHLKPGIYFLRLQNQSFKVLVEE